MNYEECMEYVGSLLARGIVPGLDSIKALCKELGNPQDKLRFIHIAGTNGKGSTLAYISCICQAAGLRTGRYISPTIFEYRERFQINARMITKKDLGQYMERVKAACDRMVEKGLPQPTPFEVETALAFLYFQEKLCDIVVLETGMGGLLDATNLIQTTLVSVLASIGMDHMGFLGKTQEEIAKQKAGIIKPGKLVVTMEQEPCVMQVIQDTAQEQGATLLLSEASKATAVKYGLAKQSFTYKGLKKVEIPLAGKFQIANAILAIDTIMALQKAGIEISEKAIRKGLLSTVWPGRFELAMKKPVFIVDGGHNEDAAKKLRDSIQFYFTNKRIIYIMGMLKDKECEKVVDLTYEYADQIITLTPPHNPRALSALELAGIVAKKHKSVTAVDSVEEAVEMALLLAGKEDVIIAFGSLSYLGALIRDLEKRT